MFGGIATERHELIDLKQNILTYILSGIYLNDKQIKIF